MDEITTTTATLALQKNIDRARDFAKASKADNTRRAYANDLKQFSIWCEVREYPVLPTTSGVLALYLSDLAHNGYKLATIERRRAAIVEAHKVKQYDNPANSEVGLVLEGIRRALSKRQAQKAPATVDHIARMVATCDNTIMGIRDCALLLVGFAGAFRRSELVALNVEDISQVPEGLTVTIRRSKTDQTGEGRKIGIPYGKNKHTCPVRSLKAWLTEGGIKEGAIFRSINRHGKVLPRRLTPQSVALVVKKAAAASGLDESMFGGHSLRAGLATSAAAAGVEERAIANQTGHKSMIVLRRYIRDGSLFRDNAAGKVGL